MVNVHSVQVVVCGQCAYIVYIYTSCTAVCHVLVGKINNYCEDIYIPHGCFDCIERVET